MKVVEILQASYNLYTTYLSEVDIMNMVNENKFGKALVLGGIASAVLWMIIIDTVFAVMQ